MAIRKNDNLNRRNALVLSATAVMGILYPLVGRTDDGDDNGGGSTSQTGAGGQPIALATTGIRANVVVVGGGMAGASVAKYLRLWGGSGVNVTLVEPDDAYVSNIMSNFVLTSVRSLSSLSYTWDQLATAYGVVQCLWIDRAGLRHPHPARLACRFADNAAAAATGCRSEWRHLCHDHSSRTLPLPSRPL